MEGPIPPEFIKTHLCPLRFRLPSCKPANFEAAFKSSTSTSHESRTLVQNLKLYRDQMIHALSTADVPMSGKIASVETYLPLLFSLFTSLDRQQRVPLDMVLQFEWKGSFSLATDTYKFPEIIFDVAMTLHTLAILHHCAAWESLHHDYENNITPAGQHFLKSAGIMDYLATDLLPLWVIPPGPSPARPIETDVGICNAMKEFFTAEAQAMCCAKAAAKEGGTPSNIMTKICIAVLRLLDRCLDALRATPVLRLGFEMEAVYFNRAYYSALIYFHQAESLRKNEEESNGLALGFYQAANGRITDLCTTPFAPGKPTLHDKLAQLYPVSRIGVQYLRNNIMTKQEAADRDNRLIYFHTVPSLTELSPLPEGAYLMVCKKYLPPEDNHLYLFIEPEVPKSMVSSGLEVAGSFLSSFAALTTATSASRPSAPPPSATVPVDVPPPIPTAASSSSVKPPVAASVISSSSSSTASAPSSSMMNHTATRPTAPYSTSFPYGPSQQPSQSYQMPPQPQPQYQPQQPPPQYQQQYQYQQQSPQYQQPSQQQYQPQSQPSAGAPLPWACKVCTFENKGTYLVCEMCNQTK